MPSLKDEATRGYIYRVLCAIGAILLLKNVVTGAELEAYLVLAGEVLGTGLAAKNTRLRRK